MLVESGGVETEAIKAVAEQEGSAIKKALRDAENESYQQSQETLKQSQETFKEKANIGCMILVLTLLPWMMWVLWG